MGIHTGTDTHQRIVDLVDRTRGRVYLVSPFFRLWPEFTRALARLVLRGGSAEIYTSGEGLRGSDLEVLESIGVRVHTVPRFHAKVYLSADEALFGSTNLALADQGSGLELLTSVRKAEAPEEWAGAYDLVQQVVDDAGREGESEKGLLDYLADGGHDGSDRPRRWCFACAKVETEGDAPFVCVACSARSILDGTDWYEVEGRRCTRCRADARVTWEKPLCPACYREVRAGAERPPAYWRCRGRLGGIEVWSRPESSRGPLALRERANEAVERRWATLLGAPEHLAVEVVALTRGACDVPGLGWFPTKVDPSRLRSLHVERAPMRELPACEQDARFSRTDGVYIRYRAETGPVETGRWRTGRAWATWDLALPDPGEGAARWLLPLLLHPRRGLAAEAAGERPYVALDVRLTCPTGTAGVAWGLLREQLSTLLAALHTYDATDLESWLGKAPPRPLAIATSLLTSPAPLGPGKLKRTRRGTVLGLPARTDRVVALAARVDEGEGWHLRAEAAPAERGAEN